MLKSPGCCFPGCISRSWIEAECRGLELVLPKGMQASQAAPQLTGPPSWHILPAAPKPRSHTLLFPILFWEAFFDQPLPLAP